MIRLALRPTALATTAAASVLLAPAVLAPNAGAAAVSGLAKLTADGTAATALSKQGVKIAASSGAESTKTAGVTTYLLSSTDATFGATSRVKLSGTLALSRKSAGRTRTLKLTGFEVRLGSKRRVVSAKVGGKRTDVFTLDLRKGEYTVDAKGTIVRIAGTRASLSKAAATAIGKGLAIKSAKSGAWGVLTLAATPKVTTTSTTNADGSTTTTTTVGGTTTTTTTPAGSTPPTTSTNPDGTPYVPPTPLARPATAVDLTSSTLRWHLRETLVRYLSAGEGVTASAGATAGAKSGDGNTYDYDFTPAAGSWYDAASGKTRLLFTGTLALSYKSHGLNIRMSDPQVEFNGTSSRLLATFAGATAADFSGLANLAALDLSKSSTAGTAGTTYVRTGTATHLTAEANTLVLSGFYPAPDDDFGSLNTTFSIAP